MVTLYNYKFILADHKTIGARIFTDWKLEHRQHSKMYFYSIQGIKYVIYLD